MDGQATSHSPTPSGAEGAASPRKPLVFRSELVHDAHPFVQEIGQRYWAHDAGWLESLAALAAEAGEKVASLHAYASAGTRVFVESIRCLQCQDVVQVRSRQELLDLANADIRPTTVADCARCDLAFQRKGRARTGQAQVEARLRERREQQERLERERLRNELTPVWDSMRRAAVEGAFPLGLNVEGVADSLPARPEARAQLAALAVLRHAPVATPVPPMGSWLVPLAPNPAMSDGLLDEVVRGGLLRVHPETPLDAFEWDCDLDQVVVAHSLGDGLPAPSITGFALSHVCLYAWAGPSLGTSVDLLDRHLLDAFMEPRDESWRESVLNLATELIAFETIAFFDHQLKKHNLPPVPENHRPRLVEAAMKLANVRSLSDGYYCAFVAVKAAAAKAQEIRLAPKANMSTYGLNRFEQLALDATANVSRTYKQFNQDFNLPLSACTQVLFTSICNVLPMQATVAHVDQSLPAALPSTSAEVDVETVEIGPQMCAAFIDASVDYDPEAVVKALRELASSMKSSDRLSAEDRHAVTAAVTLLTTLVTDVAESTGYHQFGCAAAFAAAWMDTAPFTVLVQSPHSSISEGNMIAVRDLLVNEMMQVLRESGWTA